MDKSSRREIKILGWTKAVGESIREEIEIFLVVFRTSKVSRKTK